MPVMELENNRVSLGNKIQINRLSTQQARDSKLEKRIGFDSYLYTGSISGYSLSRQI